MKLLTTKEAAKNLGVSVRRVQAMIKSGKLIAKKVGRDYVILLSDLDEVRERTVGRPKKEPDS